MDTPAIPTDATSVWYRAALLHKTLQVLGYPVTRGEVETRSAGKDTRKKIASLKAGLDLKSAAPAARGKTRAVGRPSADTSPSAANPSHAAVLDAATTAAIGAELSRRGLTSGDHAFIVAGTVRSADGQLRPRQQLLAFDLDLAGVGVYRTVETLTEIRDHPGFEILAEAASDRLGTYSVTFYDWQYRRAERKKADVVVYAVDDDRIVGRTRMLAAEDYSDAGLARDLDIVVSIQDRRTEYQALMEPVGAFIKESGTKFEIIAESSDQLAFTAQELDLDPGLLSIAAQAKLLSRELRSSPAQEVLYGIGRQGIGLSWKVLHKKSGAELRAAIARSTADRIIREWPAAKIDQFLTKLHTHTIRSLLAEKTPQGNATVDKVLSAPLSEEPHRIAFLAAVQSFAGADYSDFWTKHLPQQPEFAANPDLVSRLLLSNQLTVLSGGHPPLVEELQVNQGVTSTDQLFDLEPKDWIAVVKKAGIPDGVPGDDAEAKAKNYVARIRELLDAAYPTKRIAKMIEKGQVAIEHTQVAKGIQRFFSANGSFDFVSSRVSDFQQEIAAAEGANATQVTSELMKLQRVFQVSPTPDAMSALLEQKLHSAYAIRSIPRQSFVRTYAGALGGELEAFQVHQRASQIATKTELGAMRLLEYSHGAAPMLALSSADRDAATTFLKQRLPNYSELFGRPDGCECKACRSVYSAAAYLVDILRFLWRGTPNADGKSPLDMLQARRPDLFTLPLTCENSNTLIPYVDLANEVMEYYTATDSITNFAAFDTGEATAEELRANPQNVNLEAYRTLKDATYPFTLPYHQPLDVIRTFSDQLGVSRYEAMKAVNPTPDATTARAIAAESLGLCQEEYAVLTGNNFDGSAAAVGLPQSFGYAAAADLEPLSGVPELLRRSGVKYIDLVELVKTRFLNPHAGTLTFLQLFLAHATIDAATLYARLKQIEGGALDPATDADITAAITAYNAANGTTITPPEFAQWTKDHLKEFRQVITLFEPSSTCALDTTQLRTMESIYDGLPTSGVSQTTWSKLQRFVRLWRKLGWTIHDTDLMLTALGDEDITGQTLDKLEAVTALKSASHLDINQVAAFWGRIDTYGDKSLYRKLFLNKAVQPIDPAFQPNAWGEYLTAAEPLDKHRSTILAGFRLREDDLAAILRVASIADAGGPRPIDPATDRLDLANLSTIYRHAALARALKLRVTDLCDLIALFGAAPFSTWNVPQQTFVDIAPRETQAFYRLAGSVKAAGFKTATLGYILRGTPPPNSALALKPEKVLQTARSIREAFTAIASVHPDTAPSPLSAEVLTANLTLTFQADVVARLMGMLAGDAALDSMTDKNLAVVVPSELGAKYAYVKGSGRLSSSGVMTDSERATLKGLANANAHFQAAVDELYLAPERFIAGNFGGIFADLAEANETLLDHPAQPTAATPEQRYRYVYRAFIPVLRTKLRRDAITQQIAALIGLSEPATGLIIAADLERLMDDLSAEGFTATYFSDPTLTTAVKRRTDPTVDFAWGTGAPDPAVPADQFSAAWEAHLTPPASGEYTFIVDVAEPDEAFRLYLDDALLLEKAAAEAMVSKEVVATLNAAQMPRLRLEYVEIAQDSGVHLAWKTATSATSVVPAAAAYPTAVVDSFLKSARLYHRAAKFITGFGLAATELDRLIRLSTDFGNIDFKALSAEHWKRVEAYTTLRDAVPQAHALLTDVFAAAAAASPVPTTAGLQEILLRATAWDEAGLAYLVGTAFGLGVNDFRNEIAPNRLLAVMTIARKTGLSAETVTAWGKAETDFDRLNGIAQRIKGTVKARFQDDDWVELAGGLSNRIRANQKQALAGYLLTRPAIQAWGAEDLDGLFEYFLIDCQMGTCMDTSRIVQAHAAVQMFVSRCLLNLESDVRNGAEQGVSPGAIDRDRWEWMKNYRVWEANRKVFLYPENWLEPEWRNDRSEFFKELESFLVQNDITDRTVEQGFRGYLASLNQVANLDMCGMCREDYADGRLKFLHVFGRTHTAPYKYFYRRWNEFGEWSAWEHVPVAFRPVETAGVADTDNSGIQLMPVLWKHRLFVFAPEFAHVQYSPAAGTKTVRDTGDTKVSELAAIDVLQIRLAWSEYADGKWTPKRVTKEYVREKSLGDQLAIERDYLLTPSIDPATQELRIAISDTWRASRGSFTFADIESPVRVREPDLWRSPKGLRAQVTVSAARMGTIAAADAMTVAEAGAFGGTGAPSSPYAYDFSKRRARRPLRLKDDDYLTASTDHKLLPIDAVKGLDIPLTDPFFFSDGDRTYFARPAEIRVVEAVRNPSIVRPDVVIAGINMLQGRPVSLAPFATVAPPLVLTAGDNGGGHAPAVPASAATVSKERFLAELPQTTPAFGGRMVVGWHYESRLDTGLEFHTFHHPFSSRYVEELNRGGLPGLMESDVAIPSDEGSGFEARYRPNFTNGFVQKPDDFATRTYYKDNVCFDPRGANELYNRELFLFAPLYVAIRLSRNGRYEEALKWFHFVFQPMTNELPAAGQPDTARYWRFLPFKTTPVGSLEDMFRALAPNSNPAVEDAKIKKWRDNPFQPHLIAADRPLAYMKHVVMAYVENLLAWGDSKFRQFTRESVNEALQLYVMANHILGPRPELVPRRGDIKAETYESLKDKWDDFSNALVELENLFPYSSAASLTGPSAGTSLLGVGSALYFGIPANDKLLEHWDTAADRLFKIRHCQDIDGVERRLALFAPPIDPAVLIQATSQGLSLGSILADLSSPAPLYRFSVLLQKANEFCAEVRSLGGALLAALEKKDAEELGRLRASHETQILELMTAVKERQVLDARASKEGLEKSRATATFRRRHYTDLLGKDVPQAPDEPTLPATLTADSQLPADTALAVVKPDVDESLVDAVESGIKLIKKEREEIDKLDEARDWQIAAHASETLAAISHALPDIKPHGTPLGVGSALSWGGTNLGNMLSATGKVFDFISSFSTYAAMQAAKTAGYIRREQEWTLQANLAAKEIVQLDKQITSAAIRVQVAETELANHQQQIENAQTVELFLQDKFTRQELYQWMKEQLFAVYKQSYDLAFDMAKKAEKAYRSELGVETASFVQYGYWDSSTQGLAAGEKLQLALRQLEKSYLEENRRELELTKSVSLARLDPAALIRLRETGRCNLSLPEESFDLDFRGHYFRRLKSARLTIPCIAGPYTSVNCTLRLTGNTIRINTAPNSEGKYEHENDEGTWIDDERFRTSYAPVQAIATSSGQNDAGMFEFAFRDERYLPFELAGAISDWQLELSTDKELRQFDYSTISDVILHLSYTAREQGGLFKEQATTYIKSFMLNAADNAEQPFLQLLSMRYEFPSEWYRFMRPGSAGGEQVLSFTVGRERLPFFAQDRGVVIPEIEVFVKGTKGVTYDAVLSHVNHNGDSITSGAIGVSPDPVYEGVQKVVLKATDAGLDLEDLDIDKPMSVKLKRSTAVDFTALVADPAELEDLLLILRYRLVP